MSTSRFLVTALAALLIGAAVTAGALSWADARHGDEVWNSCPSDDPLPGPNGELYHRDPAKQCRFVDEDGDVVTTDAQGNDLCKEQLLVVACDVTEP